jgi:outer membrane protein OmpA-like peptidoglycan-associated protein
VGDEPDRGGVGKGNASIVSGAVPALAAAPVAAPPLNPAFAERRASEALDRLAGLVTIRHEKRGAVITMSNDRLVDSGQWALTTSGQYSLRELAVGLRDQAGHVILIQGYTDSMGSPAVNEALSLRRAEAVRDYLSTQGVAAETMRAEGFGAKRPVAHNGTAEGRAQNRRIEIVIAPAPTP